MLWRSNSLRHSLCCKPWLHVKVKESSPKNVWLSRCTYILNKGVRCSKPEVYNLKIVLHSRLGRIDLLLSSCFSPAERLMFYFTRLNGWEWYCWWLKSSNSWDVKKLQRQKIPTWTGRPDFSHQHCSSLCFIYLKENVWIFHNCIPVVWEKQGRVYIT